MNENEKNLKMKLKSGMKHMVKDRKNVLIESKGLCEIIKEVGKISQAGVYVHEIYLSGIKISFFPPDRKKDLIVVGPDMGLDKARMAELVQQNTNLVQQNDNQGKGKLTEIELSEEEKREMEMENLLLDNPLAFEEKITSGEVNVDQNQ